MKRFFTFLLIALLAIPAAFAVRPLKRFFVKTQSDGTQIVVARHGDGHNGVVFYVTQDERVLVQNNNGDLCYAVAQGSRLRASDFIAHEPPHRSADEVAFLQKSALDAQQASQTLATRKHRLQKNRISSGSSSRKDGLGTYGKTGGGAVSSIGEFTIPVIMVEFSDVKFQESTTKSLLNRMYNEVGFSDGKSIGSVRDYFTSQSGGMFRPKFDVVTKVALSKKRAEYGKDRGDNIDVNLGDFYIDAIEAAAEAGMDFSKYVYQGGVPCIILLYAGQGEANSYEEGSADYLWPCEWDEDSDFTLGGKKVHINSFFIGNEIQYSYKNTGSYNAPVYERTGDPMLAGIGTFCHEFGHALGLPDFYCTDYSHTATALDYWDIMDMGPYLGDGYTPIGYTAYEKNFLGWLKIRELTGPEIVTLTPFDNPEGDHAVLVRNDKDFKEYYIFENRKADTWYPADMSGGMLAVHVAFDATKWVENVLNNDEKKLRMQVFAADGIVTEAGESNPDFRSDLFPGSKNVKKATNSGTPSMTAYTGTYMNKPLYRIAYDGENVTFNFMQEEISTLLPGEIFVVDGLYYEVMKTGEVYVTAPTDGSVYAGDVTIPAGIAYDGINWKIVGIRSNAFANCNALTSLEIGSNVADIESGALRNTPALATISVVEGNGNYEAVAGALYTKRLSGSTANGSHSACFDFANNIHNLPVSNSSDQNAGIFHGPFTYEGITLTATDGTTPTRLWQANTGMSMRIYNGGTLTFSVPEGASITKITLTTTSSAYNITKASTGTLNGKIWTGDAQSVTLTNTSASTFIGSITVEAEGLAAAAPWTLVKAPIAGSNSAFDVPEEVSIIADYALENTGYAVINLPSTLTTVGADALSMPTLTKIVAQAATPAICTAGPFTQVNKNSCELLVNETSIPSYRAAQYWKDFYHIGTIATAISAAWAQPAAQSQWFDLQGRRIHDPQHGVYIVGGRKIVR